MITNSPIKHRKKPGAIPCHSATKTSVKKCERSLFPRKRSLLYKYLVMKKKDDIIYNIDTSSSKKVIRSVGEII